MVYLLYGSRARLPARNWCGVSGVLFRGGRSFLCLYFAVSDDLGGGLGAICIGFNQFCDIL